VEYLNNPTPEQLQGLSLTPPGTTTAPVSSPSTSPTTATPTKYLDNPSDADLEGLYTASGTPASQAAAYPNSNYLSNMGTLTGRFLTGSLTPADRQYAQYLNQDSQLAVGQMIANAVTNVEQLAVKAGFGNEDNVQQRLRESDALNQQIQAEDVTSLQKQARSDAQVRASIGLLAGGTALSSGLGGALAGSTTSAAAPTSLAGTVLNGVKSVVTSNPVQAGGYSALYSLTNPATSADQVESNALSAGVTGAALGGAVSTVPYAFKAIGALGQQFAKSVETNPAADKAAQAVTDYQPTYDAATQQKMALDQIKNQAQVDQASILSKMEQNYPPVAKNPNGLTSQPNYSTDVTQQAIKDVQQEKNANYAQARSILEANPDLKPSPDSVTQLQNTLQTAPDSISTPVVQKAHDLASNLSGDSSAAQINDTLKQIGGYNNQAWTQASNLGTVPQEELDYMKSLMGTVKGVRDDAISSSPEAVDAMKTADNFYNNTWLPVSALKTDLPVDSSTYLNKVLQNSQTAGAGRNAMQILLQRNPEIGPQLARGYFNDALSDIQQNGITDETVGNLTSSAQQFNKMVPGVLSSDDVGLLKNYVQAQQQLKNYQTVANSADKAETKMSSLQDNVNNASSAPSGKFDKLLDISKHAVGMGLGAGLGAGMGGGAEALGATIGFLAPQLLGTALKNPAVMNVIKATASGSSKAAVALSGIQGNLNQSLGNFVSTLYKPNGGVSPQQ
jgi:hypothetical protein